MTRGRYIFIYTYNTSTVLAIRLFLFFEIATAHGSRGFGAPSSNALRLRCRAIKSRRLMPNWQFVVELCRPQGKPLPALLECDCGARSSTERISLCLRLQSSATAGKNKTTITIRLGYIKSRCFASHQMLSRCNATTELVNSLVFCILCCFHNDDQRVNGLHRITLNYIRRTLHYICNYIALHLVIMYHIKILHTSAFTALFCQWGFAGFALSI